MCLAVRRFALLPIESRRMSEVQAERSRLLNRQKKDRTELEKDVKKKKGALKDAAQAKLDQLEADQATELVEFDKANGLANGADAGVAAEAPTQKRSKHPLDLEWNEMSKKELQEECAIRGISKGGGKEELVTRLICWAAEERARRSSLPDGDDDEDDEDEDEDDSGDSDGSGDEDSLPDMTEDQKQEAEKQYKRELIVRKAILHLFESRFPEGFPLDDLPDVLARIKVVNFKPESLGYASLHEFARKQPRDAIFYDKGIRYLKPASKRKGH